MYKDKDKQREADRARQKRYRRDANLRRDKQGVTDSRRDKAEGVTNQGVTITEEVVWESEPGAAKKIGEIMRGKPKRGKDIKTFADLPPDVQQTIDMMSMVHDKVDETIKANRTAIAINYQHLFPDRYHSVGVA